jgi:hypothetical protein
VQVKSCYIAVPEPPLDELGIHSAVFAFERDGRALAIKESALSGIYQHLSGKAIVDDGAVFKDAGVVELWFKSNPKAENDF